MKSVLFTLGVLILIKVSLAVADSASSIVEEFRDAIGMCSTRAIDRNLTLEDCRDCVATLYKRCVLFCRNSILERDDCAGVCHAARIYGVFSCKSNLN
ncbi:unnamed protein product [Dicrocoelium dendriticum]|nr:unnamed protein product [Dicrocoelium dendriticum]